MELKEAISRYAETLDSFYLYDERRIRESIGHLKQSFPQIEFLYSIKCNSNANVLNCVFSQGFGADAASAGEVNLAVQAGLKADQIYYSAPGKSVSEIERTLGRAVLIADSLGEIKRIQAVCERTGTCARIGMRINPDFTFSADHGTASKFGIDEEQALAFLRGNSCKNMKVTGIHVHVKSQELNADTLAAYYETMLRLAEKAAALCGPLEYVNMGSGMGIPYAAADAALDLTRLADRVRGSLDRFREQNPGTKLIIEVGRYVVGKSGCYVTKVMDRKVSHGKTYLILKNTLNGFLRPSLAKLVAHYSREAAPAGTEPLFTAVDAFEFRTLKDEPATEVVTLAGNLCTAADVMAEDVLMPHLECGDVVIVTNAGSYAAVLSPMQFSSQEPPAELFLTADGKVL